MKNIVMALTVVVASHSPAMADYKSEFIAHIEAIPDTTTKNKAAFMAGHEIFLAYYVCGDGFKPTAKAKKIWSNSASIQAQLTEMEMSEWDDTTKTKYFDDVLIDKYPTEDTSAAKCEVFKVTGLVEKIKLPPFTIRLSDKGNNVIWKDEAAMSEANAMIGAGKLNTIFEVMSAGYVSCLARKGHALHVIDSGFFTSEVLDMDSETKCRGIISNDNIQRND